MHYFVVSHLFILVFLSFYSFPFLNGVVFVEKYQRNIRFVSEGSEVEESNGKPLMSSRRKNHLLCFLFVQVASVRLLPTPFLQYRCWFFKEEFYHITVLKFEAYNLFLWFLGFFKNSFICRAQKYLKDYGFYRRSLKRFQEFWDMEFLMEFMISYVELLRKCYNAIQEAALENAFN